MVYSNIHTVLHLCLVGRIELPLQPPAKKGWVDPKVVDRRLPVSENAGHSSRGHQDGAGLKAISDLLEAKGIPEDWESTGRGLGRVEG